MIDTILNIKKTFGNSNYVLKKEKIFKNTIFLLYEESNDEKQ